MPGMAQPIATLERLAGTAPRELARMGADGTRMLHLLFLQACAASIKCINMASSIAHINACC